MRKPGKSCWLRLTAATLILSASIFSFSACGHRPYNPALYPSYDVLNPGPEVRLNPLAMTEDGNLIVNRAFILWTYELQREIRKLRDECQKLKKQ